MERLGSAAEKVAENIVEDLFTQVLDWRLAEINNQVAYADIVLTSLGIKKLLVEVKRPDSLAWNKRSVDLALSQAQRYADEQKVKSIAISDGRMLYARDLIPGGQRDRIYVDLSSPNPPLELWWLSVDGLYREVERLPGISQAVLVADETANAFVAETAEGLCHPKYHLPCWCFAYIGDASNPKTWSLPYLLKDGSPDLARLPKAIQAILTNYRGARVGSVPENAIAEVLVTLAKTAYRLGKLPAAGSAAPKAYVLLQQALEQLGRWSEVIA